MLEQSLRHHYQKFLVDPLVNKIDRWFSPVHITLLSGVLGLLFIPALLMGYTILAIALLLASGYCDTLDGSLARHQNNPSSIGSVLDIMMDRFVEFTVLFTFYLLNPQERALTVILMLGSILLCITSFLVVGIFTQNDSHKSFHYSPGLMERAEAFCFFIAMVLLPDCFNMLAIVFTVLVCITALIRIRQFVRAELWLRNN
ncbi:CDP-alcohol phosphatidyltransferase family protein [Legionella spiritensis]|uniref:CDP-alcohol phosphatidyltransferase family protein n=1 Tax=Legionella spiritensis TaxID=452 RepID=UPI000F700FE0|nr:CDP-alcohol phosphatidyltransferase family protein [Legionella spiritensis]VEG91717.1 cytochrome oxidase-like protein [Legionella spiritensis]